jgi:hypothetical protein
MRSEVSTHSLTPMSLDQAKALVRRYLGSFPSLNLHDPEIYIADLCTLLCGYPLWAGEKAIEKVKELSEWPATRAKIKPLLDDHVRLPKFAQEWDRNARAQIAETEMLALEGPKQRKLSYEGMRAKYDGPNGEPWGIADTSRPPTKSKQQLKDELIAKIGQAAFDAIPDAPVSMDKLGKHAPQPANRSQESHVKHEAAE